MVHEQRGSESGNNHFNSFLQGGGETRAAATLYPTSPEGFTHAIKIYSTNMFFSTTSQLHISCFYRFLYHIFSQVKSRKRTEKSPSLLHLALMSSCVCVSFRTRHDNVDSFCSSRRQNIETKQWVLSGGSIPPMHMPKYPWARH